MKLLGSIVVLMMVLSSKIGAAAEVDPAKIDAIFAGLKSNSAPGGAVLVLKNGRAVFARGYGVTDLRSFGRVGAHTNFRLASVSKQFTAMAVMLLVHDGKLRYDWPISSGRPGDDTPDGSYLTIEKANPVQMVGPGYSISVPWSVLRITGAG